MDPQAALDKANSILEEIRSKEANATVLDIETSQVELERDGRVTGNIA